MAYGYDAANRLTSVTDWNLAAVSYTYDDAGRMTAKTLPASTGIVSTYTYDSADRLLGMSHVQNGQTTIASVAYTLDAVGNRLNRSDQQGLHTYTYDNLYRLTSVTYPGPSTTSYAFDAFGNRTSMTTGAGTTTYSYDDADRLTQVQPPLPAPPVPYTWDNNGNLTNRGADTFTWDYEDRMVSAVVNGTTSTFTYRGDGLRDSRTVGITTTTFTWDINAALPEVLDDGNRYVYGAGLESMLTATGTYYYLADGLGSTMAIADSTGIVAKSYTYDVYGKPTATGTLANEFDFAGQQTDPTGLQYLRARYMDPDTGTFVSREPLALAPGWTGSLYGYGAANPARYADPSGRTLTEVEGGTTHCRHECVVDFDYEGGAWDHPERNWVKEQYYSAIVGLVRPLIGEYHKELVGCVRDIECRANTNNLMLVLQGLGPDGVDQTVRNAALASPWPWLASAYAILRAVPGFSFSQVWAAYKYEYTDE
ncbi:MAG: hypothetical protein KJ053_09970 [Dehalococcoidia bacterium]|nr:hypothetical protein [Dehalococcoidia bacterium]